MKMRTCPDGQEFDILLKVCLNKQMKMGRRIEPSHRKQPVQKPHSATEPVPKFVDQLRTKTTTSKASKLPTMLPPVLVLSHTLWIFMVLIILGSILILTVWFVIFRQQKRVCSNLDDPVPEQKPLQKSEPLVNFHPPHSERNGHACQRPADALSPRHQLHPWVQTGLKREDCFTGHRDPVRHGCKEGGRELPACSSVVDHRVPLPATELQGTALVTTKTL